MKQEKCLILASNSPRRRELLALGGYPFETAAAEIDETPLPGENPREYVLRLAESKARAGAAKIKDSQAGCLVIGSDTTVVDVDSQGRDEILGKPEDNQEAAQMLKRLRGRTHQVLTAIAVVRSSDGAIHSGLCSTQVRMRDYLDEEIREYVESGDPMDKAGAYAIQHEGFHPVESLEGCYPNVVGLPLCYVVKILAEFDYPPQSDIIKECQGDKRLPCRVYRQVVGGEE